MDYFLNHVAHPNSAADFERAVQKLKPTTRSFATPLRHPTPEPRSAPIHVDSGSGPLRTEIEHIRRDGLTVAGSRHKVMLRLAQWACHVERRSREEVQKELEELAKTKLNGLSQSTSCGLADDIKRIVKTVHKYPIKRRVGPVHFSDEEIAFLERAPRRLRRTIEVFIQWERTFSTKGGTFFASAKSLGEHTGQDERTVWRHIRDLVSAGFVKKVKISQERDKANEYCIVWERGEPLTQGEVWSQERIEERVLV